MGFERKLEEWLIGLNHSPAAYSSQCQDTMHTVDINTILHRIRVFELSFHPFICWINSAIVFARFLLWRFIKQKNGDLRHLLACHRFLFKSHRRNVFSPLFLLAVEKIITKRLRATITPRIECDESKPVSKEELNLLYQSGIVLKKTRGYTGDVVERGVILICFNECFHTLRRCVNMAALLEKYTLVLEPGWSGHANMNILSFTQFSKHDIIVMASEDLDFVFLKRLGSNLVPINLNCGDWVNPKVFQPLQGIEKRYDVVFIAQPALYKRHHVLFQAIRDIKDKTFQVVIVAGPWHGDRRDVEALIDFYGIRQNTTYFENLKPHEVNLMLNRAKVNAVLSLQEGGNRCLFEGFFAGVPGLALKCNVGIRKDHFNARTGKLISERNLARELLYFRDHWQTFSPREWAERNITPEISTARLNAVVQKLALQRGEPWTTDLVPKCNCPNPEYYPTADAGKDLPTMREIISTYASSEEIRAMIESPE